MAEIEELLRSRGGITQPVKNSTFTELFSDSETGLPANENDRRIHPARRIIDLESDPRHIMEKYAKSNRSHLGDGWAHAGRKGQKTRIGIECGNECDRHIEFEGLRDGESDGSYSSVLFMTSGEA